MRTVFQLFFPLPVLIPPKAPLPPPDWDQWARFKVPWKGQAEANRSLDANFPPPFTQGETKRPAAGFYDGDGTYRVRFMPPTQGEWAYTTASNRAELNAKTGKLTVGKPAPGNRGPVRVRNTYHFAHADGTPHCSVGTTCYAWTHQGETLEEQTLATLK